MRIDRRIAAIGGPVAGLVIALCATLAAPPRPLLVWNASESAPRGLYLISDPATVRRGDMVVTRMPPAWRDLAARRHYLPANVPLVKRVAAISGDRICARGRAVMVDGRLMAMRRERDGRGRPMPAWRGCVTLRQGAMLLLMGAPASFDGRYFGETRREDVIGKAQLIWRR